MTACADGYFKEAISRREIRTKYKHVLISPIKAAARSFCPERRGHPDPDDNGLQFKPLRHPASRVD